MQVKKTTGTVDPRLDVKEFSCAGEQVHDTYWKVKGVDRLTYAEVKSYLELTGAVLSGWEIDALFTIDKAVETWHRGQK